MILFNSILLSEFVRQFYEYFQLYHWKLNQKYRNFNNQYTFKSNFFIRNTKIIVSNVNSTNYLKNNDLIFKEYQNDKFLVRNFWQRLINQYIKETVFLSPSNALSHNYVSKLKSLNLSIHKGNEYKSFVDLFNRDLVKGKINAELSSLKSSNLFFSGYKNHVYLKYTWYKLFNVKFKFLQAYQKKISNAFKSNIPYLFDSALPLFIIVNSDKEIIISESASKVSSSGVLSNFYNYFIIPNNLNKNSYTGLLFVNYNDALEYKNYIELKYKGITPKTSMQVIPTTISLYYQLMMLKHNDIEFRLIPDLKEVSNLIYHYKKYKNIKFNVDQKYGRNFFQGQPLYFIKPLFLNKQGSKQLLDLNNVFFSKKHNKDLQYQPVFLNYNTLISAWQNFKREYPEYKLPDKPLIYVFNLESFIKTYDNDKYDNNTILLPSYETYSFIKSYLYDNCRYTKTLKYGLINKSLLLRTLCMRIFWSLTSRQPIDL